MPSEEVTVTQKDVAALHDAVDAGASAGLTDEDIAALARLAAKLTTVLDLTAVRLTMERPTPTDRGSV